MVIYTDMERSLILQEGASGCRRVLVDAGGKLLSHAALFN